MRRIPEDLDEAMARLYFEHPELVGAPEEEMFRKLLGVATAHNARGMAAARHVARARNQAAADDMPRAKRRRAGRPGWPPELFWEHLRAAIRETRGDDRLAQWADKFVALDGTPGMLPGSLRRLIRKHGMPPPSE
jgi:hypothetical protein